MDNFFTRYRNETVLFAVLFIQVIALATQVRISDAGTFTGDPNVSGHSGSTRLIRVWAVAVISPFQKLAVNSGSGVRGIFGRYIALMHVRDENARLQQQLNELRLQQTRLQEDADQGRRLQSLLGFKEQFVEKTIAAQVIGTSGTDLSRVIYIDRGYRDGVEAGMAVITPDGIVGKVSRADRSTSQILLITDPLSGAGVLLERLRLNGILKGTQSILPEVLNVMADEKIEVGDKVITTGGDRVYPKGLAVGTVISVAPDKERDPFLSIRVKPAVNLGHLEEVLVVTQLSERGSSAADATTTPVRAADMLAQRLPSAKKKTDEEKKKADTSEPSAAKPVTGDVANAPSPKPIAKDASQQSKQVEKTKESPR